VTTADDGGRDGWQQSLSWISSLLDPDAEEEARTIGGGWRCVAM